MLSPPLLTCEAELSDRSFLLQRVGANPDLPVRLVEHGDRRFYDIERMRVERVEPVGLVNPWLESN